MEFSLRSKKSFLFSFKSAIPQMSLQMDLMKVQNLFCLRWYSRIWRSDINDLIYSSVGFPFYEGVSINNQPISFPMDRAGHDFHALFQYRIYTCTWVQNYTCIESFFNKILNVKYG